MCKKLSMFLIVTLFVSFTIVNVAKADDAQFQKDFDKCANLFNKKNGLPKGYEYNYDIASHANPSIKPGGEYTTGGGSYRFSIYKGLDGKESLVRRVFFYVDAEKLSSNTDSTAQDFLIRVQCEVDDTGYVGFAMKYDDKWHDWISNKK